MDGERLSAEELDAALTDADVRQVRTIALGLLAGVLGLTIVAVGLAVSRDPVAPDAGRDTALLDILGAVHLALFVGAWLARRPVSRAILATRRTTRPDLPPARRAVERLKTARTLSLALLEGPALFGLTVLIVAATRDALAAQPLYALNALSAVAFVVLTLAGFPTRERLLDELLSTPE